MVGRFYAPGDFGISPRVGRPFEALFVGGLVLPLRNSSVSAQVGLDSDTVLSVAGLLALPFDSALEVAFEVLRVSAKVQQGMAVIVTRRALIWPRNSTVPCLFQHFVLHVLVMLDHLCLLPLLKLANALEAHAFVLSCDVLSHK